MLNYTFEPLAYLLKTGLNDLMSRTWDEVGNDKELFEYDPFWERYKSMEDNDVLRFMAVRDEVGVLVGYASIIIMPNLHDRKAISSYIQEIYLEPEARKGFKTFKDFINVVLDNLVKMKVDHVAIAERENDVRGGIGCVYRRLGFRSCERIWTMNLRERKKA